MKKLIKHLFQGLLRYWRRGRTAQFVVIATALLLLALSAMYGVARWYMASVADRPRVLGASFIPAYAESLGLEPKQTMDALINEVGIRHFRLVSYWNQLEPVKDQYDFSTLDWQFQKAEASGSKVTLSIGLRQPRWPECHMPSWAVGQPPDQWYPQLEKFIAEVVTRYKTSPALDSYQLENEFFLKGFSPICTDFNRDRLISEYKLVKKLDPDHKVIITRSNNALGMPVGQPTPDEFGVSIYKRVWGSPPGRYVEYPFPSWFYASLAGFQKILTGKDMIVHELQAEAWPPNAQPIPSISLEEQNKSFNAERFKDRLLFVEGTGMREVYLWGAEYWYYRVVHLRDDSLWNVAKDAFLRAEQAR